MKMYILIKDDVPDNFAPVIAAHSSLACFLKFQNDSRMIEWINSVFKKDVCRVNSKEFENAKQQPDNVVLTESALGGREVAVVFCPRDDYHKMFKFFKRWSPVY